MWRKSGDFSDEMLCGCLGASKKGWDSAYRLQHARRRLPSRTEPAVLVSSIGRRGSPQAWQRPPLWPSGPSEGPQNPQSPDLITFIPRQRIGRNVWLCGPPDARRGRRTCALGRMGGPKIISWGPNIIPGAYGTPTGSSISS